MPRRLGVAGWEPPKLSRTTEVVLPRARVRARSPWTAGLVEWAAPARVPSRWYLPRSLLVNVAEIALLLFHLGEEFEGVAGASAAVGGYGF